MRRYLKFHRDATGGWIHPRELGPTDVVAFLNHLANAEHAPAETQNQALNPKTEIEANIQNESPFGCVVEWTISPWPSVSLGNRPVETCELAERGKYEGVAAVEGRKCGGYSGKGG